MSMRTDRRVPVETSGNGVRGAAPVGHQAREPAPAGPGPPGRGARPLRGAGLAAIALSGLICTVAGGAVAAGPAPAVYPPGSMPFGRSYASWAANWIQFMYGASKASSPFLHPERCGPARSGPVWFLGGTGTQVSVGCTMPAGHAIFVAPAAGTLTRAGGDPGHTINRAGILKYNSTFQSFGLTVDGRAVPDPAAYRVVLKPFTLRVQPDNLFDAPAGAYRSIAAGWFFMLKPLPPGRHIIVASAQDPSFPVGGLAKLTVRLTVR